jgi:single-strand DNA-binding protein
MISATVVGNLGRDAEQKQVGGNTVVEFSIASSKKVKGEDQTSWIRAAYWGKAAEAVCQYLTKGKTVAASGDLEVREYQKNDGTKGTSVELRVNSLQLLGGGDKAGASTNGTARTANTQQAPDDLPF